jgi:protein gp37
MDKLPGVTFENRRLPFQQFLQHPYLKHDYIDKFLSREPLLGPLAQLDLDCIDWVIVGGESGPGARPMLVEWVKNIRRQCVDAKVAFFFKQWGGVQKKKAGRLLEGRTYDEMPRANQSKLAA